MKFLLLTSILLMSISCSHLSSVSQTSIPKDKSKVVEAKVERGIIFLFNFDNNYIDEITTKLMNQCPNGSVEGILTKDVNITYFPIIYHKNVITASGYCVENKRRRKR
jgi:hypothetical protein